MKSANLSVLGLYNWDHTIFDNFVLPEGLTLSTLVDNLLVELAELEVMYSDPDTLKMLIGIWSRKQCDVWARLYATTQYEYNPIENYDRYESGTGTRQGSITHGGQDTETLGIMHGGQDTIQTQTADGGADSSKSGEYVAGFNPGTPSGSDDGLLKKQRNETSVDYGRTSSGNRTDAYGKTENRTGTKNYNRTEANSGTEGHELHAHGNIGTMSTQDMINQEREVSKFNIYDYIITEFKNRFCVLVY